MFIVIQQSRYLTPPLYIHVIIIDCIVSIAIIHAVNIREMVDNEMAKRYAKS